MKSLILTLAASISLAGAQQPAAFEQEALLTATELLPANLLKGTTYRVRNQVATDGYLAHFEIDSDFGTFKAIGVPAAKRTIAEIEAIHQLVETSKGDLFAEGIKRSIEQPVDAVKNIVTHPVSSVRNAPRTVGHFFVKIGKSISRGVNEAEQLSASGNDPSAAEIGRGIGNAARNAAGFEKARLDTAKQLGVDPYSDNPRLQEEIDKVTWAFFAGGLPLKIGAMAASAGLAVTATNMIGIPDDTYALTASEITLRDERALEAMGVTDEDVSRFLTHPALSTTRRHRIVVALEKLSGASGRGNIVRLANSCTSKEQADFLIDALSILVQRQQSGAASYASLHAIGRLPGATAASGELDVPAPVDYVTWTPEVADFAFRDDLANPVKVLVHTGRFSDAAASGIAAAGWRAISVPYPAH